MPESPRKDSASRLVPVVRAKEVNVDYAEVNRARDKRKAKRQKNLQQVFSGGYKQIPILK